VQVHLSQARLAVRNEAVEEQVPAGREQVSLWLLWKRCWTDARQTFEQTRVGIVQGDIEALLHGVQGDVDVVQGDLDGVSVMPAYPTTVLCAENAVLVQTQKRPQLVRAWRAGGAEGYALELAACVS